MMWKRSFSATIGFCPLWWMTIFKVTATWMKKISAVFKWNRVQINFQLRSVTLQISLVCKIRPNKNIGNFELFHDMLDTSITPTTTHDPGPTAHDPQPTAHNYHKINFSIFCLKKKELRGMVTCLFPSAKINNALVHIVNKEILHAFATHGPEILMPYMVAFIFGRKMHCWKQQSFFEADKMICLQQYMETNYCAFVCCCNSMIMSTQRHCLHCLVTSSPHSLWWYEQAQLFTSIKVWWNFHRYTWEIKR